MNTPAEILAEIKNYETIIVHRHMRPDPDAVGSQCGLAEILRASFPAKKIYQVGSQAEGLTFMATMDEISDDVYQNALVIVTDTANTPRVSDERYKNGAKLIKIDHHPNDEPYGDLLWVNTNASSCSEIIIDFYQACDDELTMTAEAARLLYTGIIGDTGRFLYPATTAHTMEVAAFLMTYNFSASEMNKALDSMPLAVAHLSGYVLSHLEADEIGAAKVMLNHELLTQFGLDDSETSDIVPLPGKVDSILAWAIFVEQPEGYYRVRLRSKGPVINELAKAHHGGGHPLASGANAKDLAEVEEIYQNLQLLVKNYQIGK